MYKTQNMISPEIITFQPEYIPFWSKNVLNMKYEHWWVRRPWGVSPLVYHPLGGFLNYLLSCPPHIQEMNWLNKEICHRAFLTKMRRKTLNRKRWEKWKGLPKVLRKPTLEFLEKWSTKWPGKRRTQEVTGNAFLLPPKNSPWARTCPRDSYCSVRTLFVQNGCEWDILVIPVHFLLGSELSFIS